MKTELILILIVVFLISCKKETNDTNNKVIQKTEIDSVKISMDANAILSLQDSAITSLSIGVYKDGKTYIEHYGELDKGKKNSPTNNTFYEIASLTKTLTGTLIAQAVLDNKLSLDDDIRKYLDGEFPNLEYKGNPILIRHILTHTSRLPSNNKGIDELFKHKNDSIFFKLNEIEKQYTKEKYFNHLKEVVIDTLPGTIYRYSNMGANLMGHVLETVYEKSYTTLLEDYIFKKSGMTNTKMKLNSQEHDQLANAYNKGVLVPHLPLSKTLWGAEGGLKSTMPDLVKYMQFQLDTTQQVVKESHKSLYTFDQSEEIGYFWRIDHNEDGVNYNHHGGAFGMNTYFFVYPEFKMGISVTTNSGGVEGSTVIREVFEGVLDDIKPFGKKSIGRAIFYKCLDTIDQGIAHYNKLKKDHINTYNFKDESELNTIGYKLLRKGKIEDAIKIFELAVSEFPSSSNPYDSLGEGYFENKQYDLALQNYKKSLALNTSNENAKTMIHKIENINNDNL
ncbi:serine hydrolase [Aquimarina longa]|uniref:serine hydrolase n=1 Tax=Aquimarina longa TaxID=1080221 RepID=UPI0007842F51|nr:serine hydrolase [Aquimarina longa]